MTRANEQTYLDHGLAREQRSDSPLWVIPRDLCTRCGACEVICPREVVAFDTSSSFPYIKTDGCIDCGLCLRVCPGIDFHLQQFHKDTFGTDYRADRMGGEFRRAYVGYSQLPRVRENGAAGGVVTHILLTLLRVGMIDGVVVVGNDPDDPTAPRPFVARTEAEIRAAAQSKYTVVANNTPLRELRKTNERFAFVGVACQIHGLKKLQELNKRLARLCVVTIGLACRGTLEREAIQDLLHARGVDPHEVRRVAHRGGPFPGKFQAEYKNGTVQDLHFFEYKDGAYNMMLRMYLPERCHLCTDYAAEFSDITCSAIWLRGDNGAYKYPEGSTLVLCRTSKGQAVIDVLSREGNLVLDPLDRSVVEQSYRHLRRERKIIPYLRIRERQRQGRHAPVYGVDVPASWKDYIFDRIYRTTFIFSKYPRLRRWMLRFVVSRPGTAFIFLKIQYKKYRRVLAARMLR